MRRIPWALAGVMTLAGCRTGPKRPDRPARRIRRRSRHQGTASRSARGPQNAGRSCRTTLSSPETHSPSRSADASGGTLELLLPITRLHKIPNRAICAVQSSGAHRLPQRLIGARRSLNSAASATRTTVRNLHQPVTRRIPMSPATMTRVLAVTLCSLHELRVPS